MASALLVTYERKPILSRNTAMKKLQIPPNASPLHPSPPELPASDSDARRPKLPSLPTSVEPPSQDSCSLKANHVQNGKDASNSSPADYAALSRNLSKDERSQLRKRLKLELDQVHSLSLKLEARELQLKGQSQPAVTHDLQSDMCRMNSKLSHLPPAVEDSRRESQLTTRPSLAIPHINQEGFVAGGKEKRTPKVNQLYLNSEFVSGKDKLSPVEKPNSKAGSNLKRSSQGNLDSRDSKRQNIDAPPNGKVDELLKQCGMILKRLMAHKFSWVFNEPVDVVKLGLHDYLKIIQRPMDLGTIKKRLDCGVYLFPNEFAEDVRLTFANAMKYNPLGHDVHVMAESLNQIFEDKWKPVQEKLKGLSVGRDRLIKNVKDRQVTQPVSEEANQAPSANAKPSSTKKSKPAQTARTSAKPKSKVATSPKRPMTFKEKQALSENLDSLPGDKLEQIIQNIKSKGLSFTQTGDEIEVDIDSFNSDTLWELHRFVMECKQTKGKSKRAADKPLQRDIAGANRPQLSNGVSRTPKTCHKGSGPGEEVDIGDDLPSGECPPVVIDKDGTLGNKNSVLSSSSSESGTSSSDSDSGSSSGSESDADDAQSAGGVPKASSVDKKPVGAVGDGRDSPGLKVNGTKNSVSDLDEENVPMKAALPGSNSFEGEGNAAESEPFHERQLRAALLRNRFADTILKAQEKTLPLNKTDRADPEQLRREREELERRQKEEKARLQAEAKAAEWARKRAEAQAAAEARRRREEAREAARLVLQNMEKSVEIDENSDILKDLEMLRSAPAEQFPSSGEETSPTHSSEGLPAFALHGGNPLEQLGLFMKSDEEDEEQDLEPVLIQADNPAGDEDEEGEIED